jgi:hypothetical protein
MTTPSLTLELDIQGNVVVRTSAGTSLRLDEVVAYHQLFEMLTRLGRAKGPADNRLGALAAPTQWDLDEPARKAKVWAQFQGAEPGEYFAKHRAVLAPDSPEARAAREHPVQRYNARGKHEAVTFDELFAE